MNGFLLDTNVVSELRKRERCAPKVSAWASTVPPNQDFLSVLVVGELRRGAILKRRTDPAGADALEKWIARLVHLYSDRILAITLEIAYEWGRLSALRPIPPEDGLLAQRPRRSPANVRDTQYKKRGGIRHLARESVDMTSATLRRGYSITMNERGKIIRTITSVRPRMKIRTRVSDGEFGSEIL